MEDRYEKLLSFDNPRWAKGSPVIFEKGALLKDKFIRTNLLQFRFRNMTPITVNGIIINVAYKDIWDMSETENFDFQYLDLEVKSNNTFGDDFPIIIKNSSARDFKITVKKVIFSDDKIENPNLVLDEIEPPKDINGLGVLRNQFVREIREVYPDIHFRTIPIKTDVYWYCVCGTFNSEGEKNCRICSANCDKLIAITNSDYLQQRFDEYEAQNKIDEGIKRNKLKTWGKRIIILALAIGIIIAAGFMVKNIIIPAVSYASASSSEKQGDFEDAIQSFQDLGDYRDSEDRLNECLFLYAESAFENKDYIEAIKRYYSYSNRSQSNDIKDRINQCWYLLGNQYLAEEKYKDAIEAFSKCKTYKDASKLHLSTKYALAKTLLKDKNYNEAVNLLESIIAYEDSRDLIIDATYNYAVELYETKNFYRAALLFMEVYPYKESLDICEKILKGENSLTKVEKDEIETFLNIENLQGGSKVSKSDKNQPSKDVTKVEEKTKYFITTSQLSTTAKVGQTVFFDVTHNNPENKIWIGHVDGENHAGQSCIFGEGYDWGERLAKFSLSVSYPGWETFYFYYFAEGKKIRTETIRITAVE